MVYDWAWLGFPFTPFILVPLEKIIAPSDQPLPCFLVAEQSTMTTESGSDSESKPDQEAEPQEAAGPQGQAGAQPGPEPAGNSEEQPALEQFPEAAAHSTPVKREVSLRVSGEGQSGNLAELRCLVSTLRAAMLLTRE